MKITHDLLTSSNPRCIWQKQLKPLKYAKCLNNFGHDCISKSSNISLCKSLFCTSSSWPVFVLLSPLHLRVRHLRLGQRPTTSAGTPLSSFLMDGCTYLGFKILTPINCHYKVRRSQDIFNITQIVFIWKKKVIYTKDGLRVSKSWGNFHFLVNYS